MKNDLFGKDEEINQLNEAIAESEQQVQLGQNEIKNRENIIKNLQDEKERLQKLLNDKQMEFVDFQNSAQQEIEILHKKLVLIDNEKNNLANDKYDNIGLIKDLQNKINDYDSDKKNRIEECKEVDKRYQNLLNAYKIKENEYNETINRLNSINRKSSNDIEIQKAKYEKKIQMLTLSNNELESRIQSLIKTLIALKDYAMSIERNMNEANNINLNNSVYTVTGGYNTGLNLGFNNNRKPQELLNNMKTILNQVDSRIYNNNFTGGNMNETF